MKAIRLIALALLATITLTVAVQADGYSYNAWSWDTNDDEMTGEKRAVVMYMRLVTDYSGEREHQALTLRIDAPDHVWLIFAPGISVQGVTGQLVMKFDDNEPLWFSAEDIDWDDLWTISEWTDDVPRIPQLCKESARVKVQVRTEKQAGTIAEFPLAGFTVVYNQAMAHVKR